MILLPFSSNFYFFSLVFGNCLAALINIRRYVSKFFLSARIFSSYAWFSHKIISYFTLSLFIVQIVGYVCVFIVKSVLMKRNWYC